MLILPGDKIVVVEHYAIIRRYKRQSLAHKHTGYHRATVTGLHANGKVEVQVNGAYESIHRDVIMGVIKSITPR